MKSLINRISRMFRRPSAAADSLGRSRLVGLYLRQTNAREELTTDFRENRQRNYGRFSHSRERL